MLLRVMGCKSFFGHGRAINSFGHGRIISSSNLGAACGKLVGSLWAACGQLVVACGQLMGSFGF